MGGVTAGGVVRTAPIRFMQVVLSIYSAEAQFKLIYELTAARGQLRPGNHHNALLEDDGKYQPYFF